MSHIKTFARIKPAKDLHEDYEIRGKIFALRVPELIRDYGGPLVKNRIPTISYDFKFDKIFIPNTNQEEIYSAAAQEIVAGFLDGYNGTIFAYGQTGTGKTYTVEGSALRFSDRGLAPRALTQIYKALEERENEEITLHISYLEIYQEVAYDLLSTTARSASAVTVFPRVTVMEGPGGTCLIRNLSIHLAASEDVAHTLLLQGQTNRKVAETPVNQRSSRSHAVFTIYLTVRKPDSDIITRSKLHLVDLAGSERVAKTGVDGQQLTEAKSINLSLHHLESVIIALQEDSGNVQNQAQNTTANKSNFFLPPSRPTPTECGKQSRHVPYRNSLLTMVLRDSLGGNCLTAMIATISLEIHNIGETLSTCRFAQRVACIANHARRNEEVDDKTLIQQLKKRIAELEASMACMKLLQDQDGRGDGRDEEDTNGKLTDEDKLACAQVVQEYIAGRVTDPVVAGITNPFRFRECLRILKKMVINKYFQHFINLPDPTSSGSTMAKSSGSNLPHQVSSTDDQRSRPSEDQAECNDIQVHRLDQTGRDSSMKRVGDMQAITDASAIHSFAGSDKLFASVQMLYAASQTGQKGKPSSAQNEMLANVPRVSVSSEHYKSPYERTREREIRRLARKVDSMKESQAIWEQNIQALQVNSALEEFKSMESTIRNKISVTQEQIADQHAYILRLRHTEASTEILAQEKLVESQLVKKEGKLQKKLEETLQHKAELESQITGTEEREQPQAKPAENRSLEEQFAQYKKRNGTLNTRQVFEMLKSEEKKQTKVIAKIEKEQKILLTKQVAAREEATREKLHLLKEMLHEARQEQLENKPLPFGQKMDGLFATHMGSVPTMTFNTFSGSSSLSLAKENDAKRGNFNNGAVNETFLFGNDSQNPRLKDHDCKRVRNIDNGNKDAKTAAVSTTVGGFTFSGINPYQSFQSQEDPPKNCALPENLSNPFLNAKDVEKSLSVNSALKSKSHRAGHLESGQQQVYGENHLSQSTNMLSSQSCKQESAVSSYTSRDKQKGEENSMLSAVNGAHNHRPSDDTGSQNTALRGSNDASDNRFLHSTKIHRVRVRDYESQLPSGLLKTEQMQVSGELHSRDSTEVDTGNSNPTIIPSEYVRCMTNGEKFDARKMGLSSETFDTALLSMLNGGTLQVSCDAEFYNKFARSPPPRKRSGRRHLKLKSAVTQKGYQEQNEKIREAWGTEAKNSPVSQRLAQFLGDHISKPKPVPPSRQDNCFQQRSYLHAENNNFVDGLEVVSPRIQALEDKQREFTYMGRVQAERERIAKIRRARKAAETIQKAWRLHRTRIK